LVARAIVEHNNCGQLARTLVAVGETRKEGRAGTPKKTPDEPQPEPAFEPAAPPLRNDVYYFLNGFDIGKHAPKEVAVFPKSPMLSPQNFSELNSKVIDVVIFPDFTL